RHAALPDRQGRPGGGQRIWWLEVGNHHDHPQEAFRRRTVSDMAAKGALDGLVVLDLTTHLSGPFCGMQLGDLGADVIKIERPQGDSMRGAPPFIAGEGAPFMLWNRNKRGIRLDLKDAADLEIFWDLVDGADVVLENFRPGVMKRLG